MGWSIGFDWNWNRDVGYGVPAICDHPECQEAINRGLSFVCGGEMYGGEFGCGLFFCMAHLEFDDDETRSDSRFICERCEADEEPFEAKPDTPEWINHKLTDESWQEWREAYPEAVEQLRQASGI